MHQNLRVYLEGLNQAFVSFTTIQFYFTVSIIKSNSHRCHVNNHSQVHLDIVISYLLNLNTLFRMKYFTDFLNSLSFFYENTSSEPLTPMFCSHWLLQNKLNLIVFIWPPGIFSSILIPPFHCQPSRTSQHLHVLAEQCCVCRPKLTMKSPRQFWVNSSPQSFEYLGGIVINL